MKGVIKFMIDYKEMFDDLVKQKDISDCYKKWALRYFELMGWEVSTETLQNFWRYDVDMFLERRTCDSIWWLVYMLVKTDYNAIDMWKVSPLPEEDLLLKPEYAWLVFPREYVKNANAVPGLFGSLCPIGMLATQEANIWLSELIASFPNDFESKVNELIRSIPAERISTEHMSTPLEVAYLAYTKREG